MVSAFLMASGLLSAQAAQAPNPTGHLNVTEKADRECRSTK